MYNPKCFWYCKFCLNIYSERRCVLVFNRTAMKFANPRYIDEELTYEDVFLFQDYFDGKSRLDADVKPFVDIGSTIPMIISNMNAVAGKRMAETMARYG